MNIVGALFILTITIFFAVWVMIAIITYINNKEYNNKYEVKEKAMFAKLQNGEISKEEYIEWRKRQEPDIVKIINSSSPINSSLPIHDIIFKNNLDN
jgi:hypothetical protein